MLLGRESECEEVERMLQAARQSRSGALVVRSFDRLLRADPGFKPEGVITIRVPMPGQIVSEGAQAFALQERTVNALTDIDARFHEQFEQRSRAGALADLESSAIEHYGRVLFALFHQQVDVGLIVFPP